MNTETLYEAIGEIQDDLIYAAESSRPYSKKIKFRPLVAACLTIALLALPVSAELKTGYVSNLLAPLYGGAQTELVDDIGVPIEASTTIGDYTLTADAVIGDRYHIAIVYSLTRTDGAVLDEWLRFNDHSSTLPSGTGGGSLSHQLSEDGTKLYIIEQWSSAGRLALNRNASVTFTDLEIHNREGQEDTLVAEGEWKLNFTIRYKNTTVKIPVHDLTVKGAGGNQYEIGKIEISPLGIHIEMTAPNVTVEESMSGPFWPDFVVSVILTDGTVLELKDANASGHGKLEAVTIDATWGAMFEEPLSVEDIQSLVICDTTLPVDISG